MLTRRPPRVRAKGVITRWHGGARADAEAVGAATLRAVLLGDQHELERGAVGHLVRGRARGRG